MILYEDASGSMGPKKRRSAAWRLRSAVRRSRATPSARRATVLVSLSIFLRKREAMTVVEVW